jgi:hypothetical protein
MNLLWRVTFVIALLAPLAASAQDTSGLVSKVAAMPYPSLAFQARVQGDVRLRSGPDGIIVISGHPLFTDAAVNNLKGLDKLSDVEIEATYHFVLVANAEFQVVRRVEKKGNRFERLILRTLNKKTEKVVEYSQCVEGETKNKVVFTENRLETWINRSVPCLMIQKSQIARY